MANRAPPQNDIFAEGTTEWRAATAEPFTKTKGFRVFLALLAAGAVAAVVIPTSLCLTGHCGETCGEECDGHWSYTGGTGPTCWPKCYDACGGSSQSPIDLDSAVAVAGTASVPSLTGYDTLQNITLVNNGHTVQGGLSVVPTIDSGLGLPASYNGAQFHFHWGETNIDGSEHVMNGNPSPMEVHFVHYSSSFPDIGAAVDQSQGLAVLGFFFQVTGSDNAALQPLIDALDHVMHKDDSYTFEMSLDAMFPGAAFSNGVFQNYFRYSGSLTTPPCFESVVWTVFTQKVDISAAQLDKFRQVHNAAAGSHHHGGAGSHNIYDNFRPVMPLGSRTLTRYSP